MSSETPKRRQYGEEMVGVSFKVSPQEKENLEKYCEKFKISQTEVVRRFFRELGDTVKKG